MERQGVVLHCQAHQGTVVAVQQVVASGEACLAELVDLLVQQLPGQIVLLCLEAPAATPTLQASNLNAANCAACTIIAGAGSSVLEGRHSGACAMSANT